MNIFIPTLTLANILLISSVQAQEVSAPSRAAEVATPAPTATPEATPGEEYRAHTQSAFSVPPGGRNPFWPIGYTPKPKNSVPVEEQLLRIPVEQYKVTSIILDTPSIAVINGKDYTRGQFLTLATATGSVKLLITNIEDGVVTVQYKALVGKIPISRR
ncbi:MAG TPA: hypothetical protein VF585_08735 [Chthoniobacterales bacterium]|jgi:hypothetical protein